MDNEMVETNLTENGEGMPAEGAADASGMEAAMAADTDGAAVSQASANGVSASAEDAILHRAYQLTAQAEAIRRVSGRDMMALFETDVDIRGKVLAGEMDFVDVWQSLGGGSTPPSPVRSANGGTGRVNVSAMTAGQFSRLNELLAQGGTVKW